MFKSILGGLLMATGALVLAAGVVGLIVVVDHLLDNRERDEGNKEPQSSSPETAPLARAKAKPHFSIKRTKSEVGYIYWILEGHGKYKCFVLCDSWEEAIEQAKSRLGVEIAETQEFAFAHS